MFIYDVDGNVIAAGGGSSDSGASIDVAREKLVSKVFIAIGDSYTEGLDINYTAIANNYGLYFDNRGRVSASVAERIEGNEPAKRMPNIVDRIVSDYTSESGYYIGGKYHFADDVALITFMGGVNDANGIANRLGTGIHDTERTLMYGALNYMFSILQETFVNATILCVTQPPSYNHQVSEIKTDSYAQEIGFDNMAEAQVMTDVQLSTYCLSIKENIIKNMAWAYGLPILDLYTEFPTVHNANNRAKYWNSDKLHLTDNGKIVVANALDRKILELFGH